jgi:protein-S-isoprenylcysteine O-methyltransferase Ste14
VCPRKQRNGLANDEGGEQVSAVSLESLVATEPTPARTRAWQSRETWARAVPAGFFVGLAIIRRDAIASSATGLVSATSLVDGVEAGLMLLFILLNALFYLFIAALFLGRLAPRASSQGRWPAVLAMAGTWGAAPMALMPIVNNGAAWTLTANLVTLIGMAASCLALFTLGRHFGIRPRARGVVSHGIYARIRHPLYVFEAIAQLGTLIVVFSPAALAVFVAYLGLQLGRALTEERLLAATFPAYREYMARTSRFIPGVV